MHEAGYAGDHRHHHNGQRIDADCPIRLEFADAYPRHEGNHMLFDFHARRCGDKTCMMLLGARVTAKTCHIGKQLDQRQRAC